MKFIKEKDPNNKFDTTNIVFETESITLDDILCDFADFLKACGYSLPNSDTPIILDINEDEQ